MDRIAATGRANIAFLPYLHVKLYHAETNYGSFALVGSANFTKKSLVNWELGLLVEPYAEGKRVNRDLKREADDIYRNPGRRLEHQAKFS